MCVAPRDVEESALLIDVVRDVDGVHSIVCYDGGVVPPTTKSIIQMLITMRHITVLTDRDMSVQLTFGGVLATTPDAFAPGFTCQGPTRTTMLQKRSASKICVDGMTRTPVPTTLHLVADSSDPPLDYVAPLQIGRNLLKVIQLVIPARYTDLSRAPGGSRD
jgi:hypothetical protein